MPTPIRGGHRPLIPRLALAAALLAAVGDAALAATIIVDTTADVEADDGSCSLREAATAANTDAASGATPGECVAGAGADDIVFALPSPSVIGLTYAPIVFTASVSVWGPGPQALTVAQAGLDRVFVLDGELDPDAAFTLSGLLVTGGAAETLYDSRNLGVGGGVLAYRVGKLTIRDAVLQNHHARTSGGALAVDSAAGDDVVVLIEDSTFENGSVNSGTAGGGGAISLELHGTATIRRCLFFDNDALNQGLGTQDDGTGGALWVTPDSDGTLEISQTTFSGNLAHGDGGALAFGSINAPANSPTVTTTIVDSTFTGNTADADSDTTGHNGGGLTTAWLGDVLTLRNTVVAGNYDLGTSASDTAPDLYGTSLHLATGGHNFIGVRRGATVVFPAGQPNANDDWVGTIGNPLDPGLGALAENGGPTRTHAPLASPVSPLVDQGSCTGAPSTSDGRGFDDGAGGRIHDDPAIADHDDGCDVGAVELGLAAPAAILVDGFATGDWREWSGIVGWGG